MSSNQTGEVVKLLTLITVITTPLMMVGTWYGMNFHDMPELSWKHGYTIAATTMLASTLATYLDLRKRAGSDGLNFSNRAVLKGYYCLSAYGR